jgi:P27 family predicted phage terminase small subunit
MTTGRPRKPLARHRLVGSYRRDRHGTDHPEPMPGDMECPAWVDGEARRYWDAIAPMLAGSGVSSPVYSIALALLVDALARYVQLEERLSKEGPTVLTVKGEPKTNPIFRLRNVAWNQTVKALREFGLTPSALASVRTAPPQAEPGGDGIAGRINPKLTR